MKEIKEIKERITDGGYEGNGDTYTAFEHLVTLIDQQAQEIEELREFWKGVTQDQAKEYLESTNATKEIIDQQAEQIKILGNQLTTESCKNAESALVNTRLELAVKALEEIKDYHNIEINTSSKLMRVKKIAENAILEIRKGVEK